MKCRLWTMSRSLLLCLRAVVCVGCPRVRSASTKPPGSPSSKQLGGRCMSADSSRDMGWYWPDYSTTSASKWIEDMEAGAIG